MKPGAENRTQRSPRLEWLLIVIFAALLWLPTVDYFSGIDVTRPTSENRLLAPKPRLTRLDFSGMHQYAVAAEIYFNDHFGFRKRLIRWFQQWKTRLFHDQGVSMNRVILGQHHWMFYAEFQMVEHYLGIAKFTPAQLEAWQKLLEKRRDWLAARGIKYLVVIPPDKHNIYPEELPAWLANAAPANRVTKLDQLLEYMQKHSTVEILDLRPPLLAAKNTAPTYLQNDAHWNLFGGFVACQEVVKKLSFWFPDLPPLRLEDFIWTNAPANGGDLALMLGSDAPEKNYFTFQPGPNLPALHTNDIPAYQSNWGLTPVFTRENPGPLRRKVVMFRDSFGKTWQPFLGQVFKLSVFEADDREFCPALISANAPDVVVNEILERFVNTLDPEEMIAKDALP